jgi:hypothetical protein
MASVLWASAMCGPCMQQRGDADVSWWRDEPDWYEEETDNPLLADDRNFYKVEKWTKDGTKVERLLYAGNNLEKAQKIFAEAIKHRPRIRLTIRQRTQILERWRQTQ